MTREELLQQIKAKANSDRKNRKDRRFLDTMGLLVAKGFLRTNLAIPLLPNKRIRLKDAIWAGENVEPRILEVLPAAVLRLGKHFDKELDSFPELKRVLGQLRRREELGEAFFGMPYAQIRKWVDFPLMDRRIKTLAKKKIAKTFRLAPDALDQLRKTAKKRGVTETEVVEDLLRQSAL